jgi:hypothetical protein
MLPGKATSTFLFIHEPRYWLLYRAGGAVLYCPPGRKKEKGEKEERKRKKRKEKKKEEERSVHQTGQQFGSFLKILSQDSRPVTKGRKGSPNDRNCLMTVSLKASLSKHLTQSVLLKAKLKVLL